MPNNDQSYYTPRESFLVQLLRNVVKEYKLLLEKTQQIKPFRIIEIGHLSKAPGETEFVIQVSNKQLVMKITAAKIISERYDLNKFSMFHAEMIRQAAQGKLIEFLQVSNKAPAYKIVSKKFDKTIQQYIFNIETAEQQRFLRTAEELSKDKNLLKQLDLNDIYDIGYTQGSESILKEKMALLMVKNKLKL